MILRVVRAEYLGAHRLHAWFKDATDGEVDLRSSLDGPIFEPLSDIDYFKRFRLEGHTLA